jgi:hypothetical protein
MSKKLSMTFATALGSTSSLSLDEPRTDITEEEVRTVMQSIITENIFNTSSGDLTEIKSAEIITTTTETLI